MNSENKNLLLYVLKCVAGCAIVFTLSWLFCYPEITWCIISVMLVLTPESDEAIPLAITRIKANFIAGIASLIFLLLFPPSPFTIIIVIIVTILLCYRFKIMSGSRAAIAAVIIIMLHGKEYSQSNFWTVTLERISSVIIGCFIGLIVTIFIHKKLFKKHFLPGKPDEA